MREYQLVSSSLREQVLGVASTHKRSLSSLNDILALIRALPPIDQQRLRRTILWSIAPENVSEGVDEFDIDRSNNSVIADQREVDSLNRLLGLMPSQGPVLDVAEAVITDDTLDFVPPEWVEELNSYPSGDAASFDVQWDD